MGPARLLRQAFLRGRGSVAGRATSVLLVDAKLVVCLTLVGVLGCKDHGRKASGPHDYVRCMAVDADDEASGTVGRARFTLEDRTLRLEGLPTPLRIAAFRGAGGADPALAPAIAGVTEQQPGLVFVLGGLGPDAASARAHLDALGALGLPVVVLPGGDDAAEVFGDAMDAARERHRSLFDGRRLRSVVVGEERFVLLSGAPEGRYAASEAHCGNDEDDRDEIAELDGGRRWLVSWAAPGGGGREAVGRGFDGVDAGDPRVAALAHALGDAGGIFAFPATRALVPSPADGTRRLEPMQADAHLRLVVPRIAGPVDERDDLSLAPLGAAVMELGGGGLSLVGTVAGGAP